MSSHPVITPCRVCPCFVQITGNVRRHITSKLQCFICHGLIRKHGSLQVGFGWDVIGPLLVPAASCSLDNDRLLKSLTLLGVWTGVGSWFSQQHLSTSAAVSVSSRSRRDQRSRGLRGAAGFRLLPFPSVWSFRRWTATGNVLWSGEKAKDCSIDCLWLVIDRFGGVLTKFC